MFLCFRKPKVWSTYYSSIAEKLQFAANHLKQIEGLTIFKVSFAILLKRAFIVAVLLWDVYRIFLKRWFIIAFQKWRIFIIILKLILLLCFWGTIPWFSFALWTISSMGMKIGTQSRSVFPPTSPRTFKCFKSLFCPSSCTLLNLHKTSALETHMQFRTSPCIYPSPSKFFSSCTFGRKSTATTISCVF